MYSAREDQCHEGGQWLEGLAIRVESIPEKWWRENDRVRSRFFYGLRFRLTLLILFVLVTSLGIVLYSGLQQRRFLSEKAREEALILARHASERQRQLVQSAHQLLIVLSQLPEVREGNSRASSRLFAQLLREHPYYFNIGISGPDGYVWASGLPFNKPVYVGDHAYFRNAIRNRKFTIGEYQVGRITGKPSINLGYPILSDGKVIGVIFVALDLNWLARLTSEARLPPGSVVTLIDHNGIILARYPEGEKWVGQQTPEISFWKGSFSEDATLEITGIDGVRRLYALTSFGCEESRSDKIFLSVGIPKEAIFSEVDRVLKRSLLFLSLLGVVFLLSVGLGGDLILLRKLSPVLEAAKRLGEGDLSARTGLPSGSGELGQLARTFDQMAQSLERREQERRAEAERLRESEARYMELADLLPGVVFEADEKGNITFANRWAFDRMGYSEGDLLVGLNVGDVVSPDETEKAKEAFLKALSSEKLRDEFTLKCKDGSTFPAIVQVSPIFRDGKAVGLRGVAVEISDRKQAEEALQKAFSELSAIYQNVPTIMMLVDSERRVKKVNRAFVRFTGYSIKEVEGLKGGEALRCLPSLIDPRGCGFESYCNDCLLREIINDSIKNKRSHYGREISLKFLINGKEEEKWFLVNTNPTPIENQWHVLVSLQDITRLKVLEAELKESVEALRTFINANPETSLLLDKNGVILLANETLCRRLGRPLEKVIGSSLYDLLPEDVARRRKERIDEVFKTGKALRFEDRREGRDYETFVYPIFDSEGRVQRVSILGIDVTERRQMQESLKRSEERFRELFNEAPVGYHELDMEGRITEVNQRELEMLGYSREEMVGRPVWEFVVEEVSREAVRAKLSGSLPTGIPFERTYRKKDGTLISVLITDRVLRDERGRVIGIRSAHQDITKLKEIEKEKEALEEQLRQSQKMEAIGRLAGGIAHDFNNLLTVIKGYAQLSLLGLKGEDSLRGNLEEIERASERASSLTRQLLAFSRRQVMEMKVLDLNLILRDLEKMLWRIIGEDIELTTHLSEDLWRVRTDPGQIEQVILNLVVNARDAMPRGGRLTIETSNVKLDEAYARAHVAVKPGDYVMLSVSDTGCGMTPEVRERIFEPFFTTKERGKGTGLGLSVVYGIVKQSGGNIWVYSEPNQGTTFKIYLPAVKDEEEEFRRVEVSGEVPRGSEGVLVVEDDDSVRELAVRFLEKQGYHPFEARQGEEALEIFKTHRDSIRLILVDVVMSKESGPELIKRLKEISQDFKVLYMSGYTDNAIVHHGVLDKGVEFIQKPFSFEGLLRKVREVLDKEA